MDSGQVGRVRTRQTHEAWEFAIVLALAIALAVALTYPLAARLGSVGRVDSYDGKFSIWNVAWVARTLVVDPLHVFDANIFYPHRGTLAYSEANLGAGAVAIPAYWVTRNPYAAHNFAVLVAFALCVIGTYYLARYLTHDPRAAVVSAICYAFCPSVFGHTPHVQLLMTFGLPFSLLAFHRLADRPTVARGLALGAAMAVTAYFCAYYGVFVLLMVGFVVIATAAMRRLWLSGAYWSAVAIAAAAAVVLILPLFEPYRALQETRGFSRSLDEARQYAADWRSYFTSSARAHLWIERFISEGREVSFPGFVASLFAVAGIVTASRADRRTRQLVLLYGALGALALWASFGPDAGLYAVLYHAVPGFTLMRAPSRFGLVVAFAMSILAGFGVKALLARIRHATVVGVVVAVVAAAELPEVLLMPSAPPAGPEYRLLATLPRGPVIELPFWYPPISFFRNTGYMLESTAHWMPLVNGYSDYIPPDYTAHLMTLAPFPTHEGLKLLEPNGVRYAIFHRWGYNQSNWKDVMARAQELAPYLRLRYLADEGDVKKETRLYEIVGFPP